MISRIRKLELALREVIDMHPDPYGATVAVCTEALDDPPLTSSASIVREAIADMEATVAILRALDIDYLDRIS